MSCGTKRTATAAGSGRAGGVAKKGSGADSTPESEYMRTFREAALEEARAVYSTHIPEKIRRLHEMQEAPAKVASTVNELEVRRELMETVMLLKTLRLWLTMELPPASDAGSFTTQVQRLLVDDLKAAADACAMIMAQSNSETSAVLRLEELKHPESPDWSMAMSEFTEAQEFASRRRLADVASVLSHIENIVLTNSSTIAPLLRLSKKDKQ